MALRVASSSAESATNFCASSTNPIISPSASCAGSRKMIAI
jgi:hypothetical protein